MMNTPFKKGFTILELLVCVLILAMLTAAALPYYQNAVQSARNTEAVIWWGQFKRMAAGASLTQQRADRWNRELQTNNRLKYFIPSLHCRAKETQEPCWEAEVRLKTPGQHVQYYLTTQKNFAELLCVPLNSAGESFCQSQSGQDGGPDASDGGRPAYILRY